MAQLTVTATVRVAWWLWPLLCVLCLAARCGLELSDAAITWIAEHAVSVKVA